MKPHILLYFSLFILHFSLCTAQTWEPVGGGVSCPGTVFEIEESCDTKDTIFAGVNTLCVYSNKLYAGGLFTSAGKIQANDIACWDGQKWNALGTGTNSRVLSLAVYKNMLLVGGAFNSAGGKLARGIARWVDTVNTKPYWYYFPRGIYKVPCWDIGGKPSWVDASIYSIATFKGDIYICGNYLLSPDGVGDTGPAFSVWNPRKEYWSPVNNIIPDPIKTVEGDDIRLLMVYRNNLYVIGDVDVHQNQFNNMLVWNGLSFKKQANFPLASNYISCTATSDSGIYFLGNLQGHDTIVRLNNDGTYKLIKCLPLKGTINTMVYHEGKLYVAGYFNHIDGISANNIAMWDGKSWHAMGAGLSNEKHFTKIECLCVYNGYLYAGGSFNHSGNKPIENIARWKLTSETHHTGR